MSVLILCHPKIINIQNGIITNHWYNDIILRILKIYNIDINFLLFDTVDIRQGGTIVDDCFSEEFQFKHLYEYDMIILPDCGGKWYTLQEEHNLVEFRTLVTGITTMLKYNSSILIDKFIYPEFRECTRLLLEELGFIIRTIDCELFGNKYAHFIFATKN